jgi:hypothetical protein
MDLKALSNQTVVLFGKSRSLTPEEFDSQLKSHHITRLQRYDASIACIIEGRLVNPVEQEELDALYERKAAPIVDVDVIEKLLCTGIDGDRLLMSLKLSGDSERLLGYLQNRYVEDALFLRLLGLYDWQGEGFFDTDENRDVTAALIARFYEHIERNHNVQYANTGLMHLIAQTKSAELIESISALDPVQLALKKGSDNATGKLLAAIAEHPAATKKVLERFVRYGADGELGQIIAARSGLEVSLQRKLFETKSEPLLRALSTNPSLERGLAEEMIDHFGEEIAAHIGLDEELFDRLFSSHPEALATNPTLTLPLQRRVFCGTDDVQAALASNESLDEAMAVLLFETNKPQVRIALAANPGTPASLLEQMARDKALHAALAENPSATEALLRRLSESADINVLSALAQNPSTPHELLYQFQLDRRLERYVRENPSFGAHIQKENIGWL